MAIVTTSELAHYMGGWRYTAVQEVDAQAILDGLQSELEDYLNRPLQMRRVLETVSGDLTGRAYLRVTPVQALHGLYRVDPDTGLQGEPVTDFPASGYVRGANYLLIGPGRRLMVDYTGGVNGDLHPGVKLALKRVAAREFLYQHDESLTLENMEGRPPADPDNRQKGWTEDELKRFDRLRRRVVA